MPGEVTRLNNVTPHLKEEVTMVLVPIALRYIEIDPQIAKAMADAVSDICRVVDRYIEDNK